MRYPLIFSYKNDVFARVNYDGTWSVDWRKASIVRGERVFRFLAEHDTNVVLSCSDLLMAAKDNFHLTPWDISSEWGNRFGSSRMITVDETSLQMVLEHRNMPAARINPDRTWSVKWNLITQMYGDRLTNQSSNMMVGYSMCQLLLAARDNFKVTPWDLPVEDED